MNYLRITLISLLSIFTTSCVMVHEVNIQPEEQLTIPQHNKIKLKAGIYFSPEFKKLEHVRGF